MFFYNPPITTPSPLTPYTNKEISLIHPTTEFGHIFNIEADNKYQPAINLPVLNKNEASIITILSHMLNATNVHVTKPPFRSFHRETSLPTIATLNNASSMYENEFHHSQETAKQPKEDDSCKRSVSYLISLFLPKLILLHPPLLHPIPTQINNPNPCHTHPVCRSHFPVSLISLSNRIKLKQCWHLFPR